MDLFKCPKCGYAMMKGETTCLRCGEQIFQIPTNGRPVRVQTNPATPNQVPAKKPVNKPVTNKPVNNTSVPESDTPKTNKAIKTIRMVVAIIAAVVFVGALVGYFTETKVLMSKVIEKYGENSDKHNQTLALASKLLSLAKYSLCLFFVAVLPLWITLSVIISAINIYSFAKLPTIFAWLIVLAEIIISAVPIIIRIISKSKVKEGKYRTFKIIYYSVLATSSYFLATLVMVAIGAKAGLVIFALAFVGVLALGIYYLKTAKEDFKDFSSTDYDGDFYVEIDSPNS